MNSLFIFYIVFSYLFTIGATTVPKGANWYNIVFAPVFFPIMLGRLGALIAGK